MPMTPDAAKKYKPRRTPESLDEVIYPETRAKMQEAKADVADAKASAEAGAEYDKVVGKKKGGMAAKFMSFSKAGKPAGMKPVTKMASGGSASSRADGIAVKGKTRGTMC
jgi:hypothetical protein